MKQNEYLQINLHYFERQRDFGVNKAIFTEIHLLDVIVQINSFKSENARKSKKKNVAEKMPTHN